MSVTKNKQACKWCNKEVRIFHWILYLQQNTNIFRFLCNVMQLYIEPALVNSKNNIIYSCIESYNVFSYNADQDEITLGQIIDVVSLQEINANLDSVLPHQSIKVPCLHIWQ